MNQAVHDFIKYVLDKGTVEVEGRDVLDVGSQDVVGSIRGIFTARNPNRYVGLDIEAGPCVDVVGDAEQLTDLFGPDQFDVVVSTEMLEHVWNWQRIVREMAGVCKVGGKLLWTTRSHDFPYHGYPDDCWRYTPPAMLEVLRRLDVEPEVVVSDPQDPGVFVLGTKRGHSIDLPDRLKVPGVTEAPSGFGTVHVDVLNVWHGGDRFKLERIAEDRP